LASTVRPITAPALPVLTSTTSGTITTFTWLAVACPAGTTVRYQWLYSNDAGYLGAWTAITTRVVTVTTSTEGYSYTLQVKAQCYNTYATSAFGATDIASYIRPVQMPDLPITFSIIRQASNQIAVRASSTCNAGAVVYTTGDISIYAPYFWIPSSPANAAGWWNASHTTAWASDWLSDWGWYTMPFTLSAVNPTGTFASGSDWRIVVQMRCQNPNTGRASSATPITYGPILNAP
ncbi:hypothetical protein H7X68_03310, partial [Candidatus Saccharibacteria bacterium]|nr:hypothetical protein [Candidatus Saccharibacteria bacterium]